MKEGKREGSEGTVGLEERKARKGRDGVKKGRGGVRKGYDGEGRGGVGKGREEGLRIGQ